MNAMNRWTSPRARRWIAGLTIVATTTTLAGCGSIFYPERKGQPSGRIDPAVAIADGVGLLFYIIPGVIAYAIDFSNGTIYLPSRDTAAVNTLHFDDELDARTLESMLAEQAGLLSPGAYILYPNSSSGFHRQRQGRPQYLPAALSK